MVKKSRCSIDMSCGMTRRLAHARRHEDTSAMHAISGVGGAHAQTVWHTQAHTPLGSADFRLSARLPGVGGTGRSRRGGPRRFSGAGWCGGATSGVDRSAGRRRQRQPAHRAAQRAASVGRPSSGTPVRRRTASRPPGPRLFRNPDASCSAAKACAVGAGAQCGERGVHDAWAAAGARVA
eukprot:35157-Chlamydomonas_euryale.AAC.4